MRTKKNKSYADLLKKVSDTIGHYRMLEKGDKVLIGVSGGADSVALLRTFTAMQVRFGIKIIAANLDHGIRGKESRKDSEFVVKLTDEWGIECVTERLRDVKKNCVKISLEEKLRLKRYDFFRRIAAKKNCNVIATGHNMDDQAETVMMRLLKGSSAGSLTGISPIREEGKIKVIRPLIRASRQEILAFLKSDGIGHVEDSSNKDIRFLRNRIRAEVIPYLEKINPGIKKTLVNISDSLREELAFSAIVKKEICADLFLIKKKVPVISFEDYTRQYPVVRMELFKGLFRSAGGNIKKMTYRHWILTDSFVFSKDKGRSLDLPGKVEVVKQKGELVFRKKGV